MSRYECAADYFYQELEKHIDVVETIWGSKIELEDTMFYELCKKYSDIALNSEKWRIKGTCDIQACFKNVDIDVAKEETKKYVEKWAIKEIDLLLGLIYKMHSIAVEWNDTRCTGGRVVPENYDWKPGFAGMYYNFSMLPESVWNDISKEIKQYLI